MGMISQESINEVIAANDIVDVVASYVELEKKSGRNYFGLCPFHSEKTPSFSVTPLKQIYYCFGCHKGGNVISFIQEIEHLNFPEAVRFLAERAGIELDEDEDDYWQERRDKEKLLYQALLEAANFFHRYLLSDRGENARAYLTSRGTTLKDWRKFGLGFAPDNWDFLYKTMRRKGLDDKTLSQAGLIKRSSRGNWIDFFRNRIIFPIIDLNGNVLGFGGRALDQYGAKYINTAETLVFHKGSYLFGLPQALKAKSNSLIVVEGYMDVLSMNKAGFKNVVAPLGTALTLPQARLMQRYCQEIILLFDSDNAGIDAALRSYDLINGIGLKTRFVLLPQDLDPDDFIKKQGRAQMAALIDSAQDKTSFQLTLIERDLRDPESGYLPLLEYQDAAIDLLAAEENSVLAELYADKVAKKLGVETNRILQEIDRRHSRSKADKKKENISYATRRKELLSQQKRSQRREFISDHNRDLQLLCLLTENPALVERNLVFKKTNKRGAKPRMSEELASLNLDAPLSADDFHAGVLRELAKRSIAEAKAGKLNAASLLASLEEILAEIESEQSKDIQSQESSEEARKHKQLEKSKQEAELIRNIILRFLSDSEDLSTDKCEQSYDYLFREVRSEQLNSLRDEKFSNYRYFNARHEEDKAEAAKKAASVYAQAAAFVRHGV